MQTTGNAGGVHNLKMETDVDEYADILKNMDTGLLVTEMMGKGDTIVTGEYSRGAAGYWVERGELQYPVEEITVAGNLREMFRHFVSVVCDVDLGCYVRTGSSLLVNMTIGGS